VCGIEASTDFRGLDGIGVRTMQQRVMASETVVSACAIPELVVACKAIGA